MSSHEPWLPSVAQRLGDEIGASPEGTEALVSAVLDSLGEAASLAHLVKRIASRTSLPSSKALELAQMTCRFLAEQLDEVALAHLETWLPGDVLALFDRPDDERATPAHRLPLSESED